MSEHQAGWYVAHCKPRQERRAFDHLERQGFSCYLPMLRVERVQTGRKINFAEPLFPRYLFIRLDDVETNWHPIRSTRGVNQLVCCNGEPVPVKDDILERIRERLTQGKAHVPYLKPGERVCITEGPFARVEAIFLAKDGDERVVLLMDLLQQEQKLSFSLWSVRKLA